MKRTVEEETKKYMSTVCDPAWPEGWMQLIRVISTWMDERMDEAMNRWGDVTISREVVSPSFPLRTPSPLAFYDASESSLCIPRCLHHPPGLPPAIPPWCHPGITRRHPLSPTFSQGGFPSVASPPPGSPLGYYPVSPPYPPPSPRPSPEYHPVCPETPLRQYPNGSCPQRRTRTSLHRHTPPTRRYPNGSCRPRGGPGRDRRGRRIYFVKKVGPLVECQDGRLRVGALTGRAPVELAFFDKGRGRRDIVVIPGELLDDDGPSPKRQRQEEEYVKNMKFTERILRQQMSIPAPRHRAV